MTIRVAVAAALAAAGFLFAPAIATAQAPSGNTLHTASISGIVSDRTGAVISGATIHIHSSATDGNWTVTTDARGHYLLQGLASGSYTITVDQGGFSELEKTITLESGQASDQPLVLSIASVVQAVVVTSGPVNDGLSLAEIRQGSGRDLGEAIQEVAGVQMVRKAAIANDIAVRGLLHDNLATTFDGARLYGACSGQMDPPAYHVDLSEVDHVDVVKGPFDVSTQGALGGYVKVITRSPDAHGLAFASNASIGSYGYYNPSGVAEAGTSTLHFLAGYSYRSSEFYRDGNGSLVSELGSYRDGNENLQAFRTQSAWTKLAFEPGSNQRGEISYTRQQSGELLYPYMMMDGAFDNADRFTARYDYLQPHSWIHGLHAMAYLNKINHLMDNRLRSSAGSLPVSMSAQVVSFTDGLRIDGDLAQGLTAGYEFYRRYWNSNGTMIMMMMGMPMITHSHTLPGVTEDVNGSYLAYRRALGTRFLLTAGGRYDHSFTDASKANPALYLAYHGTSATTAHDSGYSGNVKLSWQTGPSTSVFAGVGSNIRFPDPEERFFTSDSSMGKAWVGNPLLTHPRNTEYDLGFTAKASRLTLSPLFFFSDLRNTITLYAADIEQMVTGVVSMQAQSYANVQAHQWGGELSANAPIAKGIDAHGCLSYARGTKVPQPANNILSSNLFQVPPIQSMVDLRYAKRNLYSVVSAIVTGRQDHIDTDEHEQQTAGYSVFNLKLGYRNERIQVEGGLNNLLARQYSQFLSYARNPYANGVRLPEPGRNVFINLSYVLAHKSH